jgi:PAS domain S-box-containing protein
MENVDDALVFTDASGRILSLNPAAARLSGWTDKEASGRSVGEILSREDGSRGRGLSLLVEQVLNGSEDAVSGEGMVLAGRSGKKLGIEGSIIPLSPGGGVPAEGGLILFRDVSRVEKMQENLYNEQRRLRDAQAMAMIGNWEYNPERDEYWYSREVYTLTRTDPAGHSPSGLLDFMKRFFPDWHRADPLPESLLNGDYGLKSLLTIPGKDGGNTILHLMARTARNPENGKMIVTGILQDFSELTEAKAALKASQEQLRQAARMEAVGKLSGGIAHEFSNLLQIILGYGQLLADEVEDELLQSYVEPILNTAGSARNLTRQLLLFSRKENLDMKPAALSSLVRGMAPLISRLIGEDIQLEHDLESEGDWVIVDRHQMEQVIINLCLNARDAMPVGGVLRISQDNRSFVLPQPGVDGLIPSGSYVHLCVRDGGTGIDDTILPQIFDPFFTTKQREKGTGLGLSLVYGIIRQHKGFLNIETDRNRGTSFHIYLPKKELPAESADALRVNAGEEHLDGRTVYMAEDDPMVRRLTETMLRNSGFHMESFCSGRELIDALDEGKKGDIDLFLVDVIMPDMGGVEAFHKLRSMGYDRPVLFMSGYTEERLRNLKDLENASLIRKPFTMRDLVGRIREMINSMP